MLTPIINGNIPSALDSTKKIYERIRKVFIETEGTPNPATLKFLPDCEVMSSGTADFSSVAAAARSPLARTLFDLPGVTRVFFGSYFISVTKEEEIEWQSLKPQVLCVLMEHFIGGQKTLEGINDDDMDEDFDSEDAETVQQIKEILDTRVRPSVAGDGGDVIFRGFRYGVVFLEMQGACSGCPSSSATLKRGIQSMLCHYVPEVLSVEQANY